MFNSEVLEVGIGLTLFFLLVSLLASAVREMIEGALKSRAEDLERGLRELLDDPSGQAIVRSLFDHPHIYSLFAGVYSPEKLKKNLKGVLVMPRAARKDLPTYIPAGQFATAIMDIAARGSGSWPYPVSPEPLTLDLLRARAAELPSPRLQRALLSAIDHAEGDLSKAKKNLEDWFDGTMDRVSGWYKRRTQLWLFVIGFVAAAVFNLDSITVGQRLVSDPALRKAAVAQAEKTVAEGKEAATKARTVDDVRTDLGKIGYPTGWRYDSGFPLPAPQSCSAYYDVGACRLREEFGLAQWLQVLLGWLLTGAAVTFGAPFWFDILNKFMVIRSTVKPREKSPEEGSEDRPKTAAPAPATVVAATTTTTTGAAKKPPSAPPPKPLPLPPSFVAEDWKPGFTNPHKELL